MAGEEQIDIFRSVKPACVRLSDEALKIRSGKSGPRNVISCVEDLLRVLERLSSSGQHIDQRLVNYIFFPLSHLFKERDNFPVRSQELALQCLQILLKTGWRVIEDSNTALQLLVLLTFLAQDGQNSRISTTGSNELTVASLNCASELFQSLEPSPGCKCILFETPNIPATGHAISVILDNMKYGASADVQISAVNALHKFCVCVANREVLQSFLPGIFSALSFVLTPNTKIRRPYRLLENSLSVLNHALRLLLSDNDQGATTRKREERLENRDAGWSQATAAQTKLVLANVVRLWQHDRLEVRVALQTLCWTVLEDCHVTLSESVLMMLETVIALSSTEGDDAQYLRLQRLVSRYSIVGDHAKSSVYESLVSLPRVIMSNDDDVKDRVTHQIASLVRILAEADVEMTVIDDLFYQNLRESLLNTTRSSKKTQNRVTEHFSIDFSESGSDPLCGETGSLSMLLRDKSNQSTLDRFRYLVGALSGRYSALSIANGALENFHRSPCEGRFVDLWICLSILQARARVRKSRLDYANANMDEEQEIAIRNALYDLAVAFLSQIDLESEIDWRMQVVGLEILSFQANQTKQAFRSELSDAIYPVVHLLGSSIVALRTQAISCLNAMSLACGYPNAKELLVANADYLVNAIGIQLNALDVSLPSCRVLLMIIKLCGPSLLPYLEDLVDQIFDTVKYFHGYSALVEQLFTVLEAAVMEGVKGLPATRSKAVNWPPQKSSSRPRQIRALLTQSNTRVAFAQTRVSEPESAAVETLPHKAPQQPWQERDLDSRETHPPDTAPNDSKEVLTSDSATKHQEQGAPAPTRTYKMLERIARLTQHHLPSSSPSIRTLLLSLLVRAIPFLSHHDDSFLPLVHTLWPVLLPRLVDKEAYVVAGVLDVMGWLCVGAGDFLTARIEEIWPTIQRLHASGQPCGETASNVPYKFSSNNAAATGQLLGHSVSMTTQGSSFYQDAAQQRQLALVDQTDDQKQVATYHSASRDFSDRNFYTPTTQQMISLALANFLVQLVSHVRISEAIYLEILSKMLYPQLLQDEQAAVREALTNLNPDAIRLILEKKRSIDRLGRGHSGMESSDWRKLKAPTNVEGGPRFVDFYGSSIS